MKYPSHLLKVIDVLKKLPGVGSKSAERFAFQLLNWRPDQLQEMSLVIKEIPQKLHYCPECGCLCDEVSCAFCIEPRKHTGYLCIISSPRDAFSIDSTGEYRGLYHVLGGVLSPMEGIGPEKLNIPLLKSRISQLKIQEVVIALDSTLEGDATALYLKQELGSLGVDISRLAFGLPMGSSLDFVDGGTLARAFSGRATF